MKTLEFMIWENNEKNSMEHTYSGHHKLIRQNLKFDSLCEVKQKEKLNKQYDENEPNNENRAYTACLITNIKSP